MKSKKIIIGSRGSKLALIYAERARTKLLEFCSNVEIKKITTSGDINQKDRLSEIGGKGLFKEHAMVFPKFRPTDKQTIRPGPAVAATASISSILILLSVIAFLAIKSIFSICDLAANSGTTPPNFL